MSQPAADLQVAHVPSQLTRHDAAGVLNRRWINRLQRWLGQNSPETVNAERVQLIWMPHYLIDLTIESSRGSAIQQVTLDAYGSVFALWNFNVPPERGVPAGESFPPRLDPQTGIDKAILALTNTTLQMRGQKGKPHVNGCSAIQLLYYPYWVWYYERRKGLLDLKIVDGVMGERPGNQIKRAMLEAFIDSSPGRTTEP